MNFLGLTVWVPKDNPTIIELLNSGLEKFLAPARPENISGPDNSNRSRGASKSLIETIAPLFSYRVTFRSSNIIHGVQYQRIDNYIIFKKVKYTFNYFKAYNDKIELYIDIDKTNETGISLSFLFILEMIALGLPNINEYTTLESVEINIIPALVVAFVIILILIGVF